MSDASRSTRVRGFRNVTTSAVVGAIVGVASCLAPLSVVTATVQVSPAVPDSIGATGLHLYAISGRPYGVFTAVHVLSFSGSWYKVRIDLARRAIDGGRQTPSAMCRTTAGCVAAVNGDFFDTTPPGQPDPGDEVGGIIQDCVLLHTPEIAHQQANLDGQSVSEGLNWSSTAEFNGVRVPITAINQELPMSYTKVRLPLTGTLLFTAPYALPTPTRAGRITYEFTQVDGSVSPTTINTTVEVELVAQTTQAEKVTANRVDISASAGSPLANLRVGDTMTLTTTSTAGCDNIGGHPILLDQGVAAPIDPTDTYMVKPYARTVIGWTASGGTVIMTVDGKDGVSGATAHQLVGLLRALHVVTALDLDGGDSTTLYAKGRVVNRPSHGTERPVSTGLLVVQSS